MTPAVSEEMVEAGGFKVGDRVKGHGTFTFDPSTGVITGFPHNKAAHVRIDSTGEEWCYTLDALDRAALSALPLPVEGVDENGLLPCPFCGGPASVFFVTGMAFDWRCGCEQCHIHKRLRTKIGDVTDPERKLAIEGWNRRVTPAAGPSAVAEADIRELLRIIDKVQGKPSIESVYGIYNPRSPMGLLVEKIRAALASPSAEAAQPVAVRLRNFLAGEVDGQETIISKRFLREILSALSQPQGELREALTQVEGACLRIEMVSQAMRKGDPSSGLLNEAVFTIRAALAGRTAE